METRSFTYGLVIAFLVSGLIYFLWPDGTTIMIGDLVTLDVAKQNCKDYCSDNPTIINDTVKGIFIDLNQLLVMNQLNNQMHDGFRLYMGKESNKEVCLIVGVKNGSDDINTIYRIPRNRMGPCPDICDVNSPIPVPEQ